MPSKRQVLETLSRKDLLALVTSFEIQSSDKRSKDGLVGALMAARKLKLEELLTTLPVVALRAACGKLEFAPGRQKAAMVAQLCGGSHPATGSTSTGKAKKKKTTEKGDLPKASARAKSTRKSRSGASDEAPESEDGTPATVPAEAVAARTPQGKRRSATTKRTGKHAGATTAKAKNEPAPLLSDGDKMPAPATPLRRSWFAGDPPPAEPSRRHKTCRSCRHKMEQKLCQSPRCSNWFVPVGQGAVCAECLFEREQLTMTEFMDRIKKEAACPSCGQALKNGEALHFVG